MINRRSFIKDITAGTALATLGNVPEAKAAMKTVVPDADFCFESPRKIPIITDADIVVIGGSSRAVAAAVAAARLGSKVFLVASLPYLGDDICGSFLYHRRKDEHPETAIARKVFLQMETPTPLYVKSVLENELIDNQIDFLYSSYVTNVLTDSNGKKAGVVIANRSGRQSIRCKALIDATHTASVARMCGISFSPNKEGKQKFQFTVVGNTIKEAPEITRAEVLPYTFKNNGKEFPVTSYTFEYFLKDNSYASLMKIEQSIRDKTWDPDQGDSSDLLWYIPDYSIIARKPYDEPFSTVRAIPYEAFLSKESDNVWVLGPCAGLERDVAEILMRPVHAMEMGDILGEYVAGLTADCSLADQVRVVQPNVNASDYGRIGETLKSLRPSVVKGYAESTRGALPVLGTYDVVVMGGGTAGAPAGIASARHGAKTLLLEYLHGLGGIGTLGLIGRYWDGYRDGFSSEIDKGVRAMAPEDHPRQHKDWKEAYSADWKMEWYRRELRKAGGEIWFGVLGCGALIEKNVVKGIIVATPEGRGVILANTVIDSSGSADIAIAAGASFDYTGKGTIAVQGAGLSKIAPTDYYNNNDWAFIDDSDILDVSRIYIQAKVKHSGQYDIVKIPQTRERRRVTGEHIISVYDVLNHRRYSDTISYHKSSFDTHGMIIDPYFILSPPMTRHAIYDADVPLRSLLPKGLEGILTTGLGASAHRDAMPVIRMQSCLQNQGYAVGYLAALCAKEKKPIRKIDMKKVQRYLVEIGNLPSRVLKDTDFKGFGSREMLQAAKSIPENYKGLEILLTDKKRCLELLNKQIVLTTSADERVMLASVLCILGESKYASVLEEKIKEYTKWDEGWHYTGMGQFGMSASRLDALLMALGNAKQESSLPVIIEKAALLKPEDYFSHFRAVSMAFESIGSKDAVPTLTKMLTMPGVRNHSISSFHDARKSVVPDADDVSTRNKSLKELHIARALYLCGDKDSLGEKVLRKYAEGLQGHYARYASELLANK